MYNLLMTWDPDAWEGQPYNMSRDRCIYADEYTREDLAQKFGSLDQAAITELMRLPTIFAYEAGTKKNPKFGRIVEVTERQKEVRIGYQIEPLLNFLTYSNLDDYRFELDLGKWELNRHHWAIKDVDLARELSAKGIILPEWVRGQNRIINLATHRFEVALSFPGEARQYVQDIASQLERTLGPNACFYDMSYQAQLARPNLDLFLQEIYGQRSDLIVVFIGGDYQRKEWCGLEWHAIRQIIFERRNAQIMFVRLDDGDVEGVFRGDGYIDARWKTPAQMAALIEERVLVNRAMRN